MGECHVQRQNKNIFTGVKNENINYTGEKF